MPRTVRKGRLTRRKFYFPSQTHGLKRAVLVLDREVLKRSCWFKTAPIGFFHSPQEDENKIFCCFGPLRRTDFGITDSNSSGSGCSVAPPLGSVDLIPSDEQIHNYLLSLSSGGSSSGSSCGSLQNPYMPVSFYTTFRIFSLPSVLTHQTLIGPGTELIRSD